VRLYVFVRTRTRTQRLAAATAVVDGDGDERELLSMAERRTQSCRETERVESLDDDVNHRIYVYA
jgi:hypothetical protein